LNNINDDFVVKVILVVSEEARNSLPEELSVGLVLTIYEAKGLEFDDVLLYNFFTDSQVPRHMSHIHRPVH
jgi:DNA helicase IV